MPKKPACFDSILSKQCQPAEVVIKTPDALSLLYKVIDKRDCRSSKAFITNVNHQTDHLGDTPIIMDLLDREIHQNKLIQFKGESIQDFTTIS